LERTLLLFPALLLTACTSLAPPYDRPAAPVAERYEDAQPEPGEVAGELAWQDYFTDARMQALIAGALQNNRDLRAAVARVEQARAAHGIQRADRLPTLAARLGEDRQRTPADLNLTGRPLLASAYQVDLGLASWELDFWGGVRNLEGAALESYLASAEARRALQLSLIGQVANGELALRELDERLAIARQTVASRAESLRIFGRRVEVGATSRLALTQVQTLLSQAEALAAQLEQARAAQAQALSLLVGAPLPAGSAPALEATALLPLRSGLPAELLNRRPDLLAAEHRLKATHASIGAARAAFYPRISLTAAFGTASAELGGLFAPGSQAWTISPQLALPLLDGGRRDANLSLAEARREEALAAYEGAVQAAFRDVNDALGARRWLATQLRVAEDSLAAQRERARLATLRYDNGAAAFLEVLDAQRDLLAAEQQRVQARRALLSSQVSLYAALGGGAALKNDTP